MREFGKCQRASSSHCYSLQTAHRKSQHPQVLQINKSYPHPQEWAVLNTARELQMIAISGMLSRLYAYLLCSMIYDRCIQHNKISDT